MPVRIKEFSMKQINLILKSIWKSKDREQLRNFGEKKKRNNGEREEL